MATEEQKQRGRKRKRDRSVDSNDFMDVDDGEGRAKSS